MRYSKSYCDAMLLPSEMSSVTILTHKGTGDELVATLHKSGLMAIEKTSENEGVFEGSVPDDAGVLATYDLRLSRILEILKAYEPKQKGIRHMLGRKIEKKKVKPRTLAEKIAEAEHLLNEVEATVLDTERRINELQEEREALEEKKRKLELLSLFPIDVAWLGKSRYVILKFGIATDLSPIKDAGIDFYARPVGGKKEKQWAVLLVSHVSQEEKLGALKHFEEIPIEGKGPPAQLLRDTERQMETLTREMESMKRELAEVYRKRRHDILSVREEIRIEKQEKDIYRNFGETRYTFVIQGWCLTEHEKQLKTLIEHATGGDNVTLCRRVPRNPGDAPIHLKNPRWARPFETFLELFSLPKYNEVNPTLFLGISFIIFFAVMLGDMGYGTVIFLLSLVGYFKFKESEFIRSWSFIGILLGLATMVAGFLFNGFFGDFVPRFIYGNTEQMLYHMEIFGFTLPIDALHKPVIILAIALILGLAHLNMGFAVGMYQNVKRRNFRGIVEEQIPWFLLQIGGGMLIGETLLELWTLGSTAQILAIVFTIIGIIFLFKRKGPLGFFEITGYMGDWLSYARLLALGLATAGMALAFNIVAQLLPDIVPYIGVVLMPIVLVVAHFANLLLQALGAGVHALRLQYVEFFNRFYEGGGKKFVPFQIVRKFTEEIK